jgi:hypothetical protein
MEADSARRENGDLQSHIVMLQSSQSDMIQQIQHLYDNFAQVIKELEETKQKQERQMQTMKSMMNYIGQQNGGKIYSATLSYQILLKLISILGQIPSELNLDQYEFSKQEKPPSIFITSHDPSGQHGILDDVFSVSRSPLTVQTQNLQCHPRTSMSLGPYGNQLPPSPSPSMLVSDDDMDGSSSLYSPNSPHTPSHSRSNSRSSYSYMNPLDPLSHR